jgi:hypothetical protein
MRMQAMRVLSSLAILGCVFAAGLWLGLSLGDSPTSSATSDGANARVRSTPVVAPGRELEAPPVQPPRQQESAAAPAPNAVDAPAPPTIDEQRERMRSILRGRVGTKASEDLSEPERWFARYCLLELIELDLRQASSIDRLEHAHTLMTYSIATSLDLAGRWHDEDDQPRSKPGHVGLQVNHRHYAFDPDEFPLYGEVRGLRMTNADMSPDERARHEREVVDSILVQAAEDKQAAAQYFDLAWIR